MIYKITVIIIMVIITMVTAITLDTITVITVDTITDVNDERTRTAVVTTLQAKMVMIEVKLFIFIQVIQPSPMAPTSMLAIPMPEHTITLIMLIKRIIMELITMRSMYIQVQLLEPIIMARIIMARIIMVVIFTVVDII